MIPGPSKKGLDSAARRRGLEGGGGKTKGRKSEPTRKQETAADSEKYLHKKGVRKRKKKRTVNTAT